MNTNVMHFIKELHAILFQYLTNEDADESRYQKLITFIETQKVREDEHNLRELIHSMVQLADNRQFIIFQNVIKLIDYLEDDLKKKIINNQIYHLFKKCKPLLLLLLKKKILVLDNYVLKKFFSSPDPYFCHFFYPEIKSSIRTSQKETIEKDLLSFDSEIFDSFEEKRLKGENDTFICELIRKDSIEKFKNYVNLTNFPISEKVPSSPFETNRFLIKNHPSLIEYAAFFGSINICKYLISCKVPFDDSIAEFAINGRNVDLIHIFEVNHVNMKSLKCLAQTIKIRDYAMMNYIIENSNENEEEIQKHVFMCCLKYRNSELLPDDVSNMLHEGFYYLCQYDYYQLLNSLLGKEHDKNTQNEEQK